MQQLLESNPHVWHWGAAVRPVQAKPEIVGPVIPNDTAVDEAGGIFPSVIRDNGIYRMWYNAWQWDPDNKLYISYALAYAESDDGVAWRKPALGLVEFNGGFADRCRAHGRLVAQTGQLRPLDRAFRGRSALGAR
jgi:hypothetical protein